MYNNYEDFTNEYDYTTMYEVVYKYAGIEFKEVVSEDTYQWLLENTDLIKVKRLYK